MQIEANSLGADTRMDVNIDGKTITHKADLIVKVDHRCYVIIFEYLDFYYPDYDIKGWIFTAVDVVLEHNQKVIFV